jgi:hypothetical protein
VRPAELIVERALNKEAGPSNVDLGFKVIATSEHALIRLCNGHDGDSRLLELTAEAKPSDLFASVELLQLGA